MSFGQAIQSGFQQYVTFSGRAGRSEFWFWMLFVVAASFVANIVESAIGSGGALGALFSLATFLPGLAVSIRRLHDTGRSAWWLLILYVPTLVGGALFMVGVFAVFASMGLSVAVGFAGLGIMGLGGLITLGGFAFWVYTFAQASQSGANQYGEQPGTGAAAAVA